MLHLQVNLPDFLGTFEAIWYFFLFLLCSSLVDFLLGTWLAIRQKRFDADYLFNFVESDLIPSLFWFFLAMLTAFPKEVWAGITVLEDGLPAVASAIYLAVAGKIWVSIFKHASAFGIGTTTLLKVGVKPTGVIDGDGSHSTAPSVTDQGYG